MRNTSTIASALTLMLIGGMGPTLSAQEAVSKAKVDFLKDVAPIFAKRCIDCHGVEDPEADLRLDIKAGLFPEDKELWTVQPGQSKASALFERIALPADDEDIMPAEGDPLTKQQIETIRRWIDEGADWPAGADEKIAAMLSSKKPKVEKLELPALTAEQKAGEDKAIEAVDKAGGLAMRVAADTSATEVNFSLMGSKATNQHVELASDLAHSLVRLDLARTAIDDAGLASLGKFKHLRWLNLSNTKVTDAGLAHLKGLAELRYLNLYGTGITDAGLSRLEGLAKLERLYLWQTKATKAGAGKLAKALPGVKIDMGEYADVLAKIKPPAKKKAPVAINTVCPITGKPIAADQASVFEGQRIAFCCAKCKAKFDKDPAASIDKVKEFKKADGPIANDKCPVSGKAVAEDAVLAFRGKRIGFCCGKCKAAFEKDPQKFLPKLSAVFPKAPGKNKPVKKDAPVKK